jgi:DUF2934 family protein
MENKPEKEEKSMEQARLQRIHALTAIRASQRWEKRGCPIGSPKEDWFHAEEELRVLLDVQRPPFSSISMEASTS